MINNEIDRMIRVDRRPFLPSSDDTSHARLRELLAAMALAGQGRHALTMTTHVDADSAAGVKCISNHETRRTERLLIRPGMHGLVTARRDVPVRRWSYRASVLIAAACTGIGSLNMPVACTTANESSPDVFELARQMPDCREFRSECQVCIRLPDGKLGCSNIGIACNPGRSWRCSAPNSSDGRK
jgi:hypothetical protein